MIVHVHLQNLQSEEVFETHKNTQKVAHDADPAESGGHPVNSLAENVHHLPSKDSFLSVDFEFVEFSVGDYFGNKSQQVHKKQPVEQ